MNVWILLALVAFALAGWWYISRTGRENVQEPLPQPSTNPPGQSTSEPLEPFLREVASTREALDAALASRSGQYEQAMEATFGEDLALRDRLTTFARANQLDRALLAVWEGLELYPREISRLPKTAWKSIAVSEVARTEQDQTKAISFCFQNVPFRLVEQQWHGGMNHEAYSDFELHENGVLSFGLGSQRQYDDSVDRYIPLSVSALRRGGSWARMLLNISTELDYERKKLIVDFKFHGAETVSARFQDEPSSKPQSDA